MLVKLIDKVNCMQRERELSWDTNADSDVDWSSWIDTDLPEDVDKLEDPDYIYLEEIGETPVETTSIARRYNLCNRH